MNAEATENEIKAKGLNVAPRVSLDRLRAQVVGEFFTQPTPTLTICVLTLRNGFTLVGESACASPENFDAELGRRLARDNALNKLWPLEGYLLRTLLTLQEPDAAKRLAHMLRQSEATHGGSLPHETLVRIVLTDAWALMAGGGA